MKNNLVDSLTESHRALGTLGDQLRCTVRPDEAARLFRQFALALGSHLGTMNKAVYPNLQTQDPSSRHAQASLMLGHARLAHALAELLTLKPRSSAFTDAVRDLLDATRETLSREVEVLFPMLHMLDDSQALAMALDADPYLAPLAEADAEADPANVKYVSDWMEEARLLLGTLPNVAASSV